MSVKVARVSPMKLHRREGVLLQFPFDRFFNEQLRKMIPRGDVSFFEHRRGWWVAEAHSDIATHLLREAFGTVQVVDVDGKAIIHEPDGSRVKQEEFL